MIASRVCSKNVAPTFMTLANRCSLQRRRSGVVRKDLTFDDVVRLLSGITVIKFSSDKQREHLISIAMDGLRFQTK